LNFYSIFLFCDIKRNLINYTPVPKAIVFAGFLAGFIFYLCVGNYQRAKRAMDRQRIRRMELEEEKRALALSPGGGGSSVGINSSRRRMVNGNENYDSPRSNYSGSSSMYTDEKGLAVGVGGVAVVGNNSNNLLLGGDGNAGSRFAVPQQRAQAPPRDLLGDDYGGRGGFANIQAAASGEMSV
jgi:hypothetical protein